MPRERISMRKFRDTLRLRYDAKLSYRQIAACLKLSVGVINKYLALATAAGLSWPLPDSMDDAALARAVMTTPASLPRSAYAEPDYATIHTELKRKGVTLRLLWEEYRQVHPLDGYQFTQFTVRFRQWQAHLKCSMRQTYRAAEKLFVDYSGATFPVLEVGGNARQAEIFIAVLGASRLTYAEATWTQSSPDWVSAHGRCFVYLGGVPELLVPDCLKPAVTTACRYDPKINRTYEEMAGHYGTAILPARPRHPKDKAAVENAVLVVQRWILARLRNQSFFSLAQLNTAIALLLEDLNTRPFKRLPGSRRSLFEQIEQEALRPLPSEPYPYGEWKSGRVGIDYHVELGGHFYSVPHSLVRRAVEARLTESIVAIFHGGARVASHPRSHRMGEHSTLPEHMPKAHREHSEWTPARLLAWACEVGPSTREVVAHTLEHKPHPEHGYRICLGLKRLAKRYTPARLEAACRRSVAIKAPTYASIESILRLGLDRIPMAGEDEREGVDLVHENVRGAEHYGASEGGEEVLPC